MTCIHSLELHYITCVHCL